MAGYQDYLNQAGVKLPDYYRASDSGIQQYNYYKDSVGKASSADPFKSDLTDLLVLKNLNGANDPFFLSTLTNLASSGNIDAGTQSLAKRQLYLTNQERTKAGLSVIDAPGGKGFTDVAPTFNQAVPVAPTAPYNPGTAPTYSGPTYPDKNAPGMMTKRTIGGTTTSSYTKQYNDAVAAYTAAQSQFKASQTKYTTDLAAYNAALPSYNTKKASYDIAASKYATDLQKYTTDLSSYNTKLAAYNAEATASDAALSVSKSRADEISKQIQEKAATDEQTRKMELIRSSLQGVSKLYSGRAADTITPSAILSKRPTLGGI